MDFTAGQAASCKGGPTRLCGLTALQGFAAVSIFRPGLLRRQEHARAAEQMARAVLSSIDVADVAKVMIMLAEQSEKPAVSIYSMKDLQQLCKHT